MRYHYDKPVVYSSAYGITYSCNHPVYDKCTLYTIGGVGLGVIQQRYEPKTKRTYWGEVDPELVDSIYLQHGFEAFLYARGGKSINGIYPTVSLRQIMWALRMKPLKRERWETSFDRRII